MGITERLHGRRLRRLVAGGLPLALLALSLPAQTSAQGPAYTAQAPTKGALYRDGQSGRYLLGGTWLYRPDLSDVGASQGWWRPVADTEGWTPVSVPSSFNANDLSNQSMDGWVGWYRRDFRLPAGAFAPGSPSAGRHWIIRFESVNYRATVWLNGHKLGSHAGAFLPFELDMKNLRPGVNRLIVRVDNRRGPTDLPPGPGGGWWNYGGILREVYLRAVQDADISQVQVRPLLACASCDARIEARATIRNVTATTQTVSLQGSYGSVPLRFGSTSIPPHGTWTALAAARIVHPRLWAPGHPSLYRAQLALSAHGRRIASYLDYSGIRRITVTRNGRLELNGRLLNLRGVNLHEQAVGYGAALSPAQIGRLMGWVKSLGATVIRSHYPLNPEIQELADREGILIWAEIPVWHTSVHYLDQPSWLQRAHAYLRQDILTNGNHPSVLLWSIGNELQTPSTPAEAAYIAKTTAFAHRVDPTRPVGLAISAWPGVPCQKAYRPLDVIGFNDYFGWFDAGGGSTDDRDALSPFLDTLRACYPHQALFVSEFGFEGSRNGPVEERGTYASQSNATAFHLGVFASKPWLSGAIYFPLQDFAARPGWDGGDPQGDPPWVQKGLVDRQGNPKPAFSIVQSIYRSTRQIGARG